MVEHSLNNLLCLNKNSKALASLSKVLLAIAY